MLLQSDAYEILVAGNKGSGKLMDIYTKIPTPSGNKFLYEINNGDEIFDENGNICNVVESHDIVNEPESYELIFDDGTKIKACADHLWHTYTHKERRSADRHTEAFREYRKRARLISGEVFGIKIGHKNNPKKEPSTGSIKTTKEIYGTLKIKFHSDKFITTNHSIQVQGALKLPEQNLPIPPYLLGVWLGDGTSKSGQITGIDQDIFNRIESLGYTIHYSTAKNHAITHRVIGLTTLLRDNLLYGNKHIPMIYLRASYEQRMELLRGLMDTDGCCSIGGRATFDNCNKRIIDDIYELLMTLGIKSFITSKNATLYGRVTSRAYRVSFYTTLPVFYLQRKQSRVKDKISPRHKWRFIVDCKKVVPIPMRCLTVSSKSGLFLCSESFIPTHNTLAAASKIYMDGMRHRKIKMAFFRRTLPEARETFMRYARANFPYGTYKEKVAQNKIVFPTGSECVLGHIENDKDLTKYQGMSFHKVYFDESTSFTEHQIGYIKAQVRSDNKDVAAQVIYLTNPGGVSHGFFKQRFIDNKEPFKKYETPESYARRMRESLPIERAKYLLHIRMMLDDNTFLLETDPDYLTRLHELSEKDKPALLYGSWEILSGKFFNIDERHKCEPYTPRADDNLFISCDWGTDKPFAIAWYAVQPDDHVIMYREYFGQKPGGCDDEGVNLTAEEVAERILELTPVKESIKYMVLDTACWSQDGHGVSIYELMQNILKQRGIFPVKANKDRVNGWEAMKKYLLPDAGGRPFLQITTDCPHFWRIVPYTIYDDRKQGDISSRSNDHHQDQCRMFLASRPVPRRVIINSRKPHGSLLWWKDQGMKPLH